MHIIAACIAVSDIPEMVKGIFLQCVRLLLRIITINLRSEQLSPMFSSLCREQCLYKEKIH